MIKTQSYGCICLVHSLSRPLFLSVSPFVCLFCLIILCRLLHSPFFALLLLNDDRHVPSTSPFARCRYQRERLLFSFFFSNHLHLSLPSRWCACRFCFTLFLYLFHASNCFVFLPLVFSFFFHGEFSVS